MNKYNEFLFMLKAFFHTYDPSNFSLLYAIKSSLGLFVCIVISYFLLDEDYIIFSVLSCVFIFYMNNLNAIGIRKILLLLLFMFFSSIFALFVPLLMSLDFYIFIPCFFWVFLVVFSGSIDLDFQRIGIYITILHMVLLISFSISTYNENNVFFSIIIGSSVAIVFRTFAFYTYGSFTRKSFLMLLNDLIFMSENINNNKYDEWQSLIASRIASLKSLFQTRSVNIKDSSLIKHQETAMFYLLKCEEITLTLFSLRTFLRKNKTNSHVKNIQKEIVYNLEELKNIFKDKKVNLTRFYFDRLKQLNTLPILCSSLEVLYYKFEIFKLGGLKEIKLKPEVKKLNLETIIEKLNFKDKNFQFSVKVALATSFSMFLAVFFKLDHGIWIAMGVFTLFKETINSTTINNKITIYASIIGFAIGLLIIFTINNSFLLPILFISYFACIYFKHFPYFIATIFIMMNLAIFFASLGLDYEKLIFVRVLDFIISFFIVYVFSFLWPSKSQDNIKPILKNIIKNQEILLGCILKRENFVDKEEDILNDFSNLKNCLLESKNRHNKITYTKLLDSLLEINNLCISFNDYMNVKYNKISPLEQSDINILITRFKMMINVSDDLPYYFYDEIGDKILTQDYKVRYFIEQISKRQDIVYKFILY